MPTEDSKALAERVLGLRMTGGVRWDHDQAVTLARAYFRVTEMGEGLHWRANLLEKERDEARAESERLREAEATAMALVLSHEAHIAKLEAGEARLREALKELVHEVEECLDALDPCAGDPDSKTYDPEMGCAEFHNLSLDALPKARAALDGGE